MSLRTAKAVRLLSAVVVSLGALPIAVHAAQVITLDNAIGIALERNVPLLQARTTAQLSDVAVSAAQLQFLPNLLLTTTGTRNYGRYYSSAAGSYIDETTNSLSPGASSAVTLFAGLHDVAALRQ